MVHMAEYLSLARETCIANTFFSPWKILAFPTAVQLKTKGVTCFRFRLKPNEEKASAWISAAIAGFPPSEGQERHGHSSPHCHRHCWGGL